MVEEITLVDQHLSADHESRSTDHRPDRLSAVKTSPARQCLLWLLCFLGMWLIAGPVALQFSSRMPKMQSRRVPAHVFSEERVRDLLVNWTRFGSRVIHSWGNAQARDDLLKRIEHIAATVDRKLRFEIEPQNFTDFDKHQLQNVLVRVSDGSTPSNNRPSVLLSAHFDSVEFSSGASDDGSGVAILLELLMNLIHDRSVTFSNTNLIVLLTNGEEISLQGARAFHLQHRWSRDVRRFVNVDSVSCSQPANLMRMQSSQLAVDYARVPRPRTNVLLQYTIRMLGIKTDYDVHTRYVDLPGYDFGFLLDGYGYHTPRDDLSTFSAGMIQELGANLLVLVRNALTEGVDDVDDEARIYFDLFGRYLFVYKLSTMLLLGKALLICTAVIVIVLAVLDHRYHCRRSFDCGNPYCIYTLSERPLSVRMKSIFVYTLSNLASTLIGIVFAFLVALLLSSIQPFAWFGLPILIFLLYGLACGIGFLVPGYLFDAWLRPGRQRMHFDFEQHLAMMIAYGFLLALSIFSGSPLLYLVMVWSIFVYPSYLLLMIVDFILHRRHTRSTLIERRYHWSYGVFIVSLPPLIHSLDIVQRLIRILAPIITRRFLIQWSFKENGILCCIVTLPTVLLALVFVPILQRLHCFGRVLIVLSMAFAVTLLFACVRQPFTNKHPNAFYAHHVSSSTFRVARPSTVPINATVVSRSSTITALVLGRVALSPLLDEFSAKSGYALSNRHCFNRANCSFDDTFNVRPGIESMEIARTNASLTYRIVVRHRPSSLIQVSSSAAAAASVHLRVHNPLLIPRSVTIIDASLNSSMNRIDLNFKLNRCDLTDSRFLPLFTQFIPNVIPMGDASCQALEDYSTLIIDLIN